MKSDLIRNDRDNDRDNGELAKRLKSLIGTRTIKETANSWGIKHPTLMNYLYKGSIPSAEVIYKIIKKEGVTIEWLFGDDRNNVTKNGNNQEESNSTMVDCNPDNQYAANGSVSDKIRLLANGRGNRELSSKWGLAPSTINSYLDESINSIPSFDKIVIIAKAENVSLDWLAGMEEAPNNQSITTDCGGIEQLLKSLPKDDVAKLAQRIIDDGINSVLFDRKVFQIAKMISDLPDESLKEILLLVNHAQYCDLVGISFKANHEELLRKKRA